MSFDPNTIVHLLKVPLINDGANTFTFSDRTAQFNYFKSKRVDTLDASDFTYQRKDGVMRVNAVAEDLWGINYVMYQNHNFGDKWFYAFASIEYVNPSVTNIKLTTDYWQTFLFDFQLGNCRIEREIIRKANDDRFQYDLPEAVGASEYVVEDALLYGESSYARSDYEVGGWIIASQVNITLNPPRRAGGAKYNGTYYPLTMYLIKDSDVTNVNLVVNAINNVYDNGINYIQAIPKFVVDKLAPHVVDTYEGSGIGIIGNTQFLTELDFGIDMEAWFEQGTISGHTVRNNKTYNYTSLVATNHAGGGKEYNFLNWETFPDGSYRFRAYGNINEGCNVMFAPYHYYQANGLMYDYGFTTQTYPTMGYIVEKSNYFQLQQQIQAGRLEASSWGAGAQAIGSAIGTGLTLGLAGASTGASTGFLSASTANLAGGMTGTTAGMQGASAGAGQLGQNVAISIDLSRQGSEFDKLKQEQYLSSPYQFGGIQGSTSNFAVSKNMAPNFYWKVPKRDEVRMIDTYFDMYGYTVERTGTPNFKKRSKWDYCKCRSVVFSNQNMPQEASNYIRETLINGMTFWHNPQTNTPYDYSQSNPDAS